MVTVLWAEPPQARRRRRKFWAPKGPFPKKSSPPLTRTHREGSAVVAHSIGRSWPDGLLPPDAPAAPAASAAVPPCQRPCCRAFCTHDGSAAVVSLSRYETGISHISDYNSLVLVCGIHKWYMSNSDYNSGKNLITTPRSPCSAHMFTSTRCPDHRSRFKESLIYHSTINLS